MDFVWAADIHGQKSPHFRGLVNFFPYHISIIHVLTRFYIVAWFFFNWFTFSNFFWIYCLFSIWTFQSLNSNWTFWFLFFYNSYSIFYPIVVTFWIFVREEEDGNSDQNSDQKSKQILKTSQIIRILKVRFVRFYLANFLTICLGFQLKRQESWIDMGISISNIRLRCTTSHYKISCFVLTS